MSESLDEVKRRLARKYLGHAGIHGLGVRRSENAIQVYLSAEDEPEQVRVLEELRQEAAPYGVVTVESERAQPL